MEAEIPGTSSSVVHLSGLGMWLWAGVVHAVPRALETLPGRVWGEEECCVGAALAGSCLQALPLQQRGLQWLRGPKRTPGSADCPELASRTGLGPLPFAPAAGRTARPRPRV